MVRVKNVFNNVLYVALKESTKFGKGAHVCIPKKFLGRKVHIIIEGD